MKQAISVTAAIVIALVIYFSFASKNSVASPDSSESDQFCTITGYAPGYGYTKAELYNQGVLYTSATVDPQNGYFRFEIDVSCYTPFTVIVYNGTCSKTMNNVRGAYCPVTFKGAPNNCW